MTPTNALGDCVSPTVRGCCLASPRSAHTTWASGSGPGDTRHASGKETASEREENGPRAASVLARSTFVTAYPLRSRGKRKASPAVPGNAVGARLNSGVTQVCRPPILLLCWTIDLRPLNLLGRTLRGNPPRLATFLAARLDQRTLYSAARPARGPCMSAQSCRRLAVASYRWGQSISRKFPI